MLNTFQQYKFSYTHSHISPNEGDASGITIEGYAVKNLTLCLQIKFKALYLEVTNSIRVHSFDSKNVPVY